jgi:hypothetical protein
LGQRLCGKFFKPLKTELETLDGKHRATEVRDSVFESYYNRKWLHSALDYSTPAETFYKKRFNLLSAQPGQVHKSLNLLTLPYKLQGKMPKYAH